MILGRTIGIGIQDFEDIRRKNCFYVDKTSFIKEWWESRDSVTLITRPRRFGKTLNMSMLNRFFSLEYAGQGEIFEGLSIWQEETYRQLQGTYPVINLSFAMIKETNLQNTKLRMIEILQSLFEHFSFLKESEKLSENEQAYVAKMCKEMTEFDAGTALHKLSQYLCRHYGKKVIILLDEYDTPMQEAYVGGFWKEIVSFIRIIFNTTFKTNPYLERGIFTGITRVSKESIFSDLNHLKVVTTTANKYETAFGFTEEEVWKALEECGLSTEKENVKKWYDGFVFGNHTDIYNPWSILNFLDTGKIALYWANTSSNSLVSKLIREGNRDIKVQFEELLKGENLYVPVDEQIVYDLLNENENAVWSLLLASGYLKVLSYGDPGVLGYQEEICYELALTNLEVKMMFRDLVRSWFWKASTDYNAFLKAMLMGDQKAMNRYMNRVALNIFSYFDTGKRPSGQEPERFYHGFVLGLMVDLQRDYVVKSNRESGFGRYDVIIEPKNVEKNPGVIIEFKVYDEEDEKNLKETALAALAQIEEKQYEVELLEKGVPEDKIYQYGFAFEGKQVWIEKAQFSK